jgi:hypothetical protein
MALVAAVSVPSATSAVNDVYIQRFDAQWSGGGSVRFSLTGSPWSVDCALKPALSPNQVNLSGLCRLSLLYILSKSIDATLKYDPASRNYSGTYSVDGGPPAILSGKRSGNDLTLDVRWPILVNGHTNAIIKIVNDGHRFTMTTIDPIGISGKAVTTSDLAFNAN